MEHGRFGHIRLGKGGLGSGKGQRAAQAVHGGARERRCPLCRYAVVGGNAVAEWVGRIDEDAVRNTRDVDILIRRDDLAAIKAALEAAGFVYCQSFGVDMFLDGPDGRPTSAVHLVFAGEKVQEGYLTSTPEVSESESAAEFRVVSLLGLVRMKLTSFRDRDRMHLRDLLDVGQIDQTWTARLPPLLAARLQELLDNPNG